MAGQKSQKEQTESEAPSFEGAIIQLQSIVAQLEDGSLPLEESMEQFERGISLLRNCYQVLEKSEQRIEVLTSVTEDGAVETDAFMLRRRSILLRRHRILDARTNRPARPKQQKLDAGRRPTNHCSEHSRNHSTATAPVGPGKTFLCPSRNLNSQLFNKVQSTRRDTLGVRTANSLWEQPCLPQTARFLPDAMSRMPLTD